MDLTWHGDPLFWILLLGPLLFVVHHALFSPDRWGGGARAVGSSKLAGAFLFGVVPAILLGALGFDPVAVALTPPGLGPFVIVVGIASMVILPLVAIAGRRSGEAGGLPQMHHGSMSAEFVVASAGVWALYLLGYEVLFRGFLLVPLVEEWGLWPALAANTGMYVLAHLHKDRSELLGCIPMGFVFGLMALYTGGIWAPWLLHVAIVLTHENATARANPSVSWWSSRPARRTTEPETSVPE
jgi:membrane protease YdiL (CAAX protease family)